MSRKTHNLLLYLTAFLIHSRVGYCLLPGPSPCRFPGVHPHVVTRLQSSTNGYDGGTNGDDEYHINGFSSMSNDWTSSVYAETEDVTGHILDDEENNFNGDLNEGTSQMSDEDIWIQNIVDEIHNAYPTLEDQPLYDTSFDEPTVDYSAEDSIRNNMDDEIAMLVRCNERPDLLLIDEGRALPPLNNEETNDVSHLVLWNNDAFEATEFLKQAVSKMFQEHAVPSVRDGILSMDRACIASWMTKSLHKEEKGKVSQHDGRVLKTLSDFSEYGSGRIVEENFQNLYLRCVVGDTSNLSSASAERHLEFRKDFRDAVWRDIRAHGMLSPVEEERLHLLEKLGVEELDSTSNSSNEVTAEGFVDECEILDWDYRAPKQKRNNNSPEEQNFRHESSHKLVEMAYDQKTPLRIRDGDFVFIDEESCIGCMQCVNIAPNSFLMMESGRARTFVQKIGRDVEQAVDACPVNCMHRVSFQELSTFETARDEGDGKTQHGLSKAHIPLHVAGMDSDRNRRSSWYHTLKARCSTSSSCPQKGCFACPSFGNSGDNPFFKAKHKQAEHIRAQHFIRNGEASLFRRAVDL